MNSVIFMEKLMVGGNICTKIGIVKCPTTIERFLIGDNVTQFGGIICIKLKESIGKDLYSEKACSDMIMVFKG